MIKGKYFLTNLSRLGKLKLGKMYPLKVDVILLDHKIRKIK